MAAPKYLECNLCGNQQPYKPFSPAVCSRCEAQWLEARYDYEAFKREILRGLPNRPSNMWRYQDVLPLNDPASIDLYPAGGTPLWLSQRYAPRLGHSSVYIKDERYGPTSSFKDRQAAGAVAAMLERGVKEAVIASTGNAAVDRLVTRGGMASMLNTVWLIITALAFGGVVEKAGVLERLITPVVEKAKSGGSLVATLVGSVFATNVATADQFIAIVLPGRMFKNAFAKRGYQPFVLSRTVGASGTPTSAIVPWNSCGAYMAATLGVATLSYAPFAIFSIASPLLAIAFAYLGIRMVRGQPAPAPTTHSA